MASRPRVFPPVAVPLAQEGARPLKAQVSAVNTGSGTNAVRVHERAAQTVALDATAGIFR